MPLYRSTRSRRHQVAFCGYPLAWYLFFRWAMKAGSRFLLLQDRSPTALQIQQAIHYYNRLDELQALVDNHHIGADQDGYRRNREPDPGFLENVRKLADAKGVVLIFDECTSDSWARRAAYAVRR